MSSVTDSPMAGRYLTTRLFTFASQDLKGSTGVFATWYVPDPAIILLSWGFINLAAVGAVVTLQGIAELGVIAPGGSYVTVPDSPLAYACSGTPGTYVSTPQIYGITDQNLDAAAAALALNPKAVEGAYAFPRLIQGTALQANLTQAGTGSGSQTVSIYVRYREQPAGLTPYGSDPY